MRKTRVIIVILVIIIGLAMVSLSGCTKQHEATNKDNISYPVFIHDVDHNKLMTMTVRRTGSNNKDWSYYFYGELNNHKKYRTSPRAMTDHERSSIISRVTVNHVDINSAWN